MKHTMEWHSERIQEIADKIHGYNNVRRMIDRKLQELYKESSIYSNQYQKARVAGVNAFDRKSEYLEEEE